MRIFAVMLPLFFCLVCTVPAVAQESQPPEAVVEKMAFKLGRGVTNVFTSVAELPKQTYITIRDRGAVGYVIGPLKGIGMTLYRGVIGGVEAIFFMVPQPGYYDPMVEPEYVWQGWEDKHAEQKTSKTE